MDIILHGGMLSAVVLVAGFSLVRLNIIKRARYGLRYWRGWVFGVGEQGRAGVGVENGGGVQRAGRGKSPACEGSVKRLAADSKGGGAGRAARVVFDEFGNKWVLYDRVPVRRARRRLVVEGHLLRTLRNSKFVVDRSRSGQSVFSMPRAGA